jgi:uncharacterized protein
VEELQGNGPESLSICGLSAPGKFSGRSAPWSRQVGKTTLALELIENNSNATYLDLENPADRLKIASDPADYFARHAGELLVLDEIHRLPELFPILRGVIDRQRRRKEANGQFLLLGSASLDLLKQSSESLAGRLVTLELTPLLAEEVSAVGKSVDTLWVRGGFPDSYLAKDDVRSFRWRTAFIQTYLERDIPNLGPRIPAETLRRFWTMLAGAQGSILNHSVLAQSLSISGQTITKIFGSTGRSSFGPPASALERKREETLSQATEGVRSGLRSCPHASGVIDRGTNPREYDFGP